MTTSDVTAWCTAFAVESVIVAIGNLFIITVFAKTIELRRQHRHYFLMNLAVADFFVGGLAAPLFVYILGGFYNLWPFSKYKHTLYSISIFLDMFSGISSIAFLSAIAVARELGMDEAQVREALKGFGGVKRRFTPVGTWNGVTIIDDYGHHPVEISAVLQAARQVAKGRVHAVMQPHRYSRLKDLFEDFSTCFNDADTVRVADVYAAGEDPIEGVSGPALVESLKSHGHRNVSLITRSSLAADLKKDLNEGDLVICLGAGDITHWAAGLAEALAA